MKAVMKHKFITLLLLSQAMLAQAAGDEHIAAAQTDEQARAELALAISREQQAQDTALIAADANYADEQEDEDQAASDEVHGPAEASAHKAYDDLLKVMPQLGSVKAKEEPVTAKLATDSPPKDELHAAIQKLAALPRMRSSIVLIYDERGEQPLHSKNADVVTPIASITKLMTAMVVLDAKLPLDEEISISPVDINKQKRTRSRTRAGMTMTRGEMLKLALMASDNLSAAALARTYPGGTEAALAQMNIKARELGMNSSRFLDPTGLNSGNVSTANDLVKMVRAAHSYELIHRFTTSTSHTLEFAGHRPVQFHNTNPLVRNTSWDIGLSKTGYISEAGRCLVMEAKITEHPVIIVLLDSWGRNSRVGDANRVKQWMEKASFKPRNL